MKKILLLSVAVISATCSFAQKEIRNANGSYYKQCARFRVTEPLWKLAAEHPAKKPVDTIREAADSRAPAAKMINATYNPNALTVDGALQSKPGTLDNKAPIVDINGQSSLLGYVPLDPNGMIGSNYYVQTVNSNYAVYNKNGTVKLAATDFQSLFGSFTCDDGDPVTIYDKFADRWVITEFQENGTCGSFTDAIDTLMMAVSTTNDPTGTYYLYYFCPDNTDYTDYPKYSIWADGYYQTCNCQNDKITVYERNKMLTGDPTAGFIVIPWLDSPNGAGGFFCPMTMYADGILPPYGSPNYLMYYDDDNWGAGFTDQLVIDSVSVNWTTKTGSYGQYQTLPTAPFDSYFTGGTRKDIDQPGKAGSFDALDGFVSYRIPYMRWNSYNAAVLCYPVNVSTNPTSPSGSGGTIIAGVRWYEIRQDTGTRQWSIYQQGTYAPNDNINRWNPSIAMDENGSIGLCYSVSSVSTGTVYPGTRYTGRTVCDSLGSMSLAEGIGATGSGTVNTSHRWGDYSHTSVDPSDGITFWHTNMYSNSGAVASKIFSFQIPKCTTIGMADISAPQIELSAYQSGSMLMVQAKALPVTGEADFDIYDIQGKLIAAKTVAANSNVTEVNFNIASLAKGIYYVRVGAEEYQRVIKVPIN